MSRSSDICEATVPTPITRHLRVQAAQDRAAAGPPVRDIGIRCVASFAAPSDFQQPLGYARQDGNQIRSACTGIWNDTACKMAVGIIGSSTGMRSERCNKTVPAAFPIMEVSDMPRKETSCSQRSYFGVDIHENTRLFLPSHLRGLHVSTILNEYRQWTKLLVYRQALGPSWGAYYMVAGVPLVRGVRSRALQTSAMVMTMALAPPRFCPVRT